MEEECVVSGALAILLRLSRWAGTAPLRLHRLHSGAYRIRPNRRLHVIESIICFCIYSPLALYRIVKESVIPQLIEIPIGNYTPYVLLIMINNLTITLMILMVVCGGERRMKKLIRIVHYMKAQIHNIDLVKPKTRKLWTAILTFVVIYFCLICSELNLNLFTSFMFLFGTSTMLSAAVHHAFFNITLYLYVKTLNKELQELCMNDSDDSSIQEPQLVFIVSQNIRKTGLIPNPLENEEDINAIGTASHTKGANGELARLAKSYLVIRNVAYNVYQSEGGLMLLMVSCHVIGTFVDVLNLLSSIKEFQTVTLRCLTHIYWMLVHFATVVAMIEPCHQLQQEMDQTKVHLSRVICQDNTRDDANLQKDLDNFFTQLMLSAPICVPMGLCTFNRSLLASILAVGSTMLIIILQFRLTGLP